jgi:hypothetical protein
MTVIGKDKKSIKGNSGKARRNREWKRFGIVLTICVIVILIHEAFHTGDGDIDGDGMPRYQHHGLKENFFLRQNAKRGYHLDTGTMM